MKLFLKTIMKAIFPSIDFYYVFLLFYRQPLFYNLIISRFKELSFI